MEGILIDKLLNKRFSITELLFTVCVGLTLVEWHLPTKDALSLPSSTGQGR